MTFTFETEYTAKNMTVMARALRKTVRKKHSRRTHIWGWILTAIGLAFVAAAESWNGRTAVTLLAVAVMVFTMLFEDRINGRVATKRVLAGTERAESVFTEEGFSSQTALGKTEWLYEKILAVAETEDFFVFIFSKSHAQLYDKRTLQGGTAAEFRAFLERVTGKPVQSIR